MMSLWKWIVNIMLKILVFKKRDKRIWLFGAWSGESYSDNSKYLFEYVVKNLPEVNAVWITKDISIKKQLQNKNFKCYLFNEKKAVKLRINAKYIFFTNGINDIGTYDLSQGSVKIALWHGMPLKKMLYASNSLQKRNKNLIRFLQYIYLKIYNPTQRSISIATSIKTKELLVKSFELAEKSVYITGQPRNDILFDSSIAIKVKRQLSHCSNEKFILYMPTWRQFGQNDIYLDSIIEQLRKDKLFLSNLERKNIKLYIKPHPRINIKGEGCGNIIVLKDLLDIDTQELLAASDILITDYSSVFIDYALLERPIYFFTPDIEEYKKVGNDLFLSFEQFSEFNILDINTLKYVILEEQVYREKGILNSQKTNIIFDDTRLKRGSYCKNVINTLVKENIINF